MSDPITEAEQALARYDEPHSAYEHPIRNFEVARALRSLIEHARRAEDARKWAIEADALQARIDEAVTVAQQHDSLCAREHELKQRVRRILKGENKPAPETPIQQISDGSNDA